MLDQKKRTVRFETSSLLPLKLVLIEAEKELPARTPKESRDVDEELALKLIAEMHMSLRRHLHRTAFGAVQVSILWMAAFSLSSYHPEQIEHKF